MQGRELRREVEWTLQPDWSGAVEQALEPKRKPVLERAWVLILGQRAQEPILKWVQVQVLKLER